MAHILDDTSVHPPCPECGIDNTVRLQDVRLQRRVLCRGCHKTIQLVDDNISTHLATQHLGDMIDEMEATLRRMLH